MSLDTLQGIASAPGVAALARQLGGVDSYYNDPSAVKDVPETIQRFLKENPDLANVAVRVDPKHPGAYFPGSDTISVGVANPAVIGHETGHAENLRKSTIYRSLLRVTNSLANINSSIALPTMLAIRALIGDQERRREILNTLAGASAALAAPGLSEELGASMAAVKNAPDKIQAIKTLLPAFLQHILAAALPTGIYQSGKLI